MGEILSWPLTSRCRGLFLVRDARDAGDGERPGNSWCKIEKGMGEQWLSVRTGGGLQVLELGS